MTEADTAAEATMAYFSGLVGRPVAAAQPLTGGRNSRVYELICDDSTRYAAKLYTGTTADGRSRVATEFASLTFLREHGFTNVPRPLAMDETTGGALYEFVEGQRIGHDEASSAEISQAVKFLLRLHEIRNSAGAESIPPAAEACFSVRALEANIDGRLARLMEMQHLAAKDRPPQFESLLGFLNGDLQPALREIRPWSIQTLEAVGRTEASELGLAERTLSPSDFGFHNCLKQDDGQLVFLDFEYFGWDDPAKMVSDFVLHPGMKLNTGLKERFCETLFQGLGASDGLRVRIQALYPLYALKWCLILLNEFLPANLARRKFSAGNVTREVGGTGGAELQDIQLEKSHNMLQTVRSSYEHFPYWGKNGPKDLG